jgi:hypothetical protein
MNWERRVREMILAGGALVAAACSGNGASGGAQDPPDANQPMQSGCNGCCDPCSGSGPNISTEPPSPAPEAGSPDAETPAEAGANDAVLESSSATALQCGEGTINGAGTDQCINAGGVCVQFPDPTCCDLVPGFDPVNSGCPHAPFAIRCCVLDGGAGKDAADGSAE